MRERGGMIIWTLNTNTLVHYLLHKWCHIESDMRCIHLKGIKYDVTDGRGVKEASTDKKECQ